MFGDVKLDLILTPDSYADQLRTTFNSAFQNVGVNRDKASMRNKIRLDRKVRACNFEVNDYVYRLNSVVKKGLSKKFTRKWTGPYIVLSQTSAVDYLIRPIDKPKARKIIIHQSHLKRAFLTSFTKPQQQFLNTTSTTNHNEYATKMANKSSTLTAEAYPLTTLQQEVDLTVVLPSSTSFEPQLELFEDDNPLLTELTSTNEIYEPFSVPFVFKTPQTVDELCHAIIFDEELPSSSYDFESTSISNINKPVVNDESFKLNDYYTKRLLENPVLPRKTTRTSKRPQRFTYNKLGGSN